MVEPTGNFSYDDNFNYIGERWSVREGDGTKGYEPRYGELGRRPYCLFPMGLWDAAEPLEDQLRRADTLLFLAGQVTVDRGYCRKTDLVHSFLLRSTGLAISLPIQVAIGAKVAGDRERKTIRRIKDTTEVIDARDTIICKMQRRLEGLGSQAREQNL